MHLRPLALSLAVLAIPTGALAAEPYVLDTTSVAIANNTDLVIELGVGGRLQPRYLGSDDYIVSPFPIISVDYLNLPGLFTVGGSERTGGLSFGPSFSYVGERDPADDADLAGLRALDPSYELGLRVGYEFAVSPTFGVEVFGAGRYAFGEAEGFVGEVGVDAISRPTAALELKAGPRASFADDAYMSTYFSVSPAESAASGFRLAAFDADAGFKTVGVAASARYEFRPDWFLNADAGYDRLVGDAESSPIALVGSRDQFTVGLGISRRFSLDLF